MIDLLQRDKYLTDEHIDHAQGMMKQQFPSINGLQAMSVITSHHVTVVATPEDPWMQVLHVPEREHWILASTFNCEPGTIKLYDSLRQYRPVSSPRQQSQLCLMAYHRGGHVLRVEWEDVSQQLNGIDCGVFAIAFGMEMCLGRDPRQASFYKPAVRQHLIKCLTDGCLTEFPTHGTRHPAPQTPIVEDIKLVCHCRQPVSKKKTIRCSLCSGEFHINCDKRVKESHVCSSCYKN